MTTRYVLHYSVCNDKRHTLLSTIKNIDYRLLGVTENVLIKTLLFGNCSVDAHTNIHILIVTILINAVFRGAVLIRGEALIKRRRLFQCRYQKGRCLLEGGAYLRPDAY